MNERSTQTGGVLAALLLTAGAGCRQDPEADAWHGAIEIDEARKGMEACDAELAPIDPPEPYVFVAIDRGVPDLATLYWCSSPSECPSPLASVWLRKLGTSELTGDQAFSELHATLCSVNWTDLVASQTGQGEKIKVEMLVRTGLFDQQVIDGDECEDLEERAVGEHCDAVLSITGTRVE